MGVQEFTLPDKMVYKKPSVIPIASAKQKCSFYVFEKHDILLVRNFPNGNVYANFCDYFMTNKYNVRAKSRNSLTHSQS